MATPLVVYHGDCYDGFTSAFIAHEYFGGKVDLWPAKYGEPPPMVEADGRTVYILDFSYPRDSMLALGKVARCIVVLDHHKTAREALDGLEFEVECAADVYFDMDRSGAGMTWDYFYPDEPRPWWVDRVEDRDLWRFRLGESTKLVHAYIASLPMKLDFWRQRLQLGSLKAAESAGQSILGYIDTYLDKAIQEARLVQWDPWLAHETQSKYLHVAVLNIPYQNASEAADKMLAKFPSADFSCGYFQRFDGRWQYSLRSRSDFDVSEIAKLFGGGGHAQAAGFDTADLLEWIQ